MLSYKRIRKISEMFDSSTNIYDDKMVMLDEDMDWNYNALNFPSSEFYSTDQFDFGIDMDEPASPQNQIRNHDCMWSGRCTTHPLSDCSYGRNNCHKKNVTDKSMQKGQQQQQQQIQIAQQQQPQPQQQQQQQQTNMSSASLLQSQSKIVQMKKPQTIPAGQSLLRLKHVKPTAASKTTIRVPHITTDEFLNNRDLYIHNRPDTPLSLDDDPPEFKHNIDLAACTVGSNKMSLIDDPIHGSPTEIINFLKEHLEDDTSNRVTKIFGTYMTSIRTDSDGLEEIINDIKSLSDFENESDDDNDDEEETDESDATNDSFNVSVNTIAAKPTQQQPQSQQQQQPYHQASVKNTITAYDIAQSMHSDHSYTRSKGRVDVIGLGVQTPSDSGTFQLFYSNRHFSILCVLQN